MCTRVKRAPSQAIINLKLTAQLLKLSSRWLPLFSLSLSLFAYVLNSLHFNFATFRICCLQSRNETFISQSILRSKEFYATVHDAI
jgi:hypothetical protein